MGILLPRNDASSLPPLPSPFAKERYVMLVEGDDKMGLQYGCYGLVRRILGVRYLSPYFEHVPRLDRVEFSSLDVVEAPRKAGVMTGTPPRRFSDAHCFRWTDGC